MAEGRKHQKREATKPPEITPPISPETLTVDEIVKKYDLHTSTVRRFIRKGVFPNAYRETGGKGRCWRVPIADLENFVPRRPGGPRISQPSAATIHSRRRWARGKIAISHGYGKREIREMIDLETEGMAREEIAARYRLAERSVADLLDPIALRKSRPKKKLPAGRQLKRLPEKELMELYVELEAPTTHILEKLNTNYASLYINLRYYGIPLRRERFRNAAQENETLLYRLALEENLSPQEIAARLKLTEPYVRRKINEIKRRFGLMTITNSTT